MSNGTRTIQAPGMELYVCGRRGQHITQKIDGVATDADSDLVRVEYTQHEPTDFPGDKEWCEVHKVFAVTAMINIGSAINTDSPEDFANCWQVHIPMGADITDCYTQGQLDLMGDRIMAQIEKERGEAMVDKHLAGLE